MPATGKVYIFNTTNQSVRIELNDTDMDYKLPPNAGRDNGYMPVNTVPGTDGNPTLISLPRMDATQTTDAAFAATNTMEIKFSGKSLKYNNIQIDPGSYPTDTDLVLYIFGTYSLLISPTNNTIVYNQQGT